MKGPYFADSEIRKLQDSPTPGPDALGAMMAGRAEELFGNAAVVSAAVAILAADLLAALPSD